MTRNLLTAACLLLAASRALGASPTLDDYSQGMAIVAPRRLAAGRSDRCRTSCIKA